MHYQSVFDRTIAVENPKLARLVTRHLCASPFNNRKPLTEIEQSVLKDVGICLETQASISHAEALNLVREAAVKTEASSVYESFACSLDPERTSLRAVLRAYSVARHLPAHRYQKWRPHDASPCRVCGYHAHGDEQPAVAAHFVWQQGTWGSESNLVGAAWTLNWFASLPPQKPSAEDESRLREMLSILETAPPNATSAKVASLLAPILGGNKYSRESFLETLGLAGVLDVPRLPGLLQTWTPWDQRPQAGEMIAPANLWRRRDGLNPEVFSGIFGNCPLPPRLTPPQENSG